MNKLALLAATLLLLFGGALWFLASIDWNGYVRSQIEIVGSKLTDNPVRVERVDLTLKEGAGSVYGVTFSNPEQYQQPHALVIDETNLDIVIKSLSNQPIIIENVQLLGSQVFVEFNKNGSSNISELLQNINAKFDQSGEPNDEVKTEPPRKQRESQETQETLLIVENLELKDIALTLDLTEVNGKVIELSLPSIQLGNIGGEQGVEASKLGAIIVQRLFKQISVNAKQQFERAAKQRAKEKLKQKASDLFNKLVTDDKQQEETSETSENQPNN
ncbi:hypothetical protein QWY77_14430 [Thalassotalea ponticola]|uniref:hypothetical protein n=1 Tax=Thalassotalea ponticola TaxID=1523392 RepID=UPI0025B39F51|nr:hypothetical protein [Thalassotalea ponticola]MDN3653934.1 hypothetical protein [Thalassotalea ponticola]